MTRRAPGFACAFAGRWRITEMDAWDEIGLLGSAHFTFSGADSGELGFIAISYLRIPCHRLSPVSRVQ